MKKILIALTLVLSLAICAPAMAFLDDNDAADADSQSNSSATIIQNTEASKIPAPKRYFAPAGEISYPGQPAMFGGATPSYMDRLKVEDMLEYNEDGLTTRMQMTLLKEKSGGKRVLVRPLYGEVRNEFRLDLDAPMAITFEKAKDMKSVGTITVVSDSTGAISPGRFSLTSSRPRSRTVSSKPG